MERLTKRAGTGEYASDAAAAELAAALGKYEDLYESIAAERELVQLNLDALKESGKGRSATYATLMGSRYMLDDILGRLDEPAAETAGRLENLRRLLES